MPDPTGPLKELKIIINRVAGDKAAENIMQNSESLGKNTKPQKIALWVKDSIERMDKILSEETRNRIMNECGHNCAHVNSKLLNMAAKRRAKYDTFQEFIEAESKKPPKGMKVEFKDNIIDFYYTPKEYGRGMRCYCGLLRSLPADQTVSNTYCNCSKGFVEAYWMKVTGKPVDVELIESAVSGSDRCRFKVKIN